MNFQGENYRNYLETVVWSLLAERQLSGKGEFETIQGVAFVNGKFEAAEYSPYNVKELLRKSIMVKSHETL